MYNKHSDSAPKYLALRREVNRRCSNANPLVLVVKKGRNASSES
ncbi:hypothetical protein OKW33_002912 [Paraburkholderia atlantica]